MISKTCSSYRLIKYSFFFLCLAFVSSSLATVSTNVPLNNWSYAEIDRLVGMGLVNSALSGTRPFTRLEMARLIKQAMKNSLKKGKNNEIVDSILTRLKHKFKEELIFLRVLEGYAPASYLKPLNTTFLRYVNARKDTLIENEEGEKVYEGSNYRVSFSLRGKLWNHLALFLQPEFEMQKDDDDWSVDSELRRIYGKIELYNLEIEVGRDSLWWGPGRHGSLFLTNNSKPYEYLVKVSNPQPFLLPWLLRYLGPSQFTMFMAELEEDRHIPKAKLLGQRIIFKPIPYLQLGVTRTYNWGGKEESEGFKEFADAFLSKGGSDEDSYNYLAGMDASLRIPEIDQLLPVMESLTLYGELGSDDEKNGFLDHDKMAYVMGVYFGDLFLSGQTNLRIEYSINNPRRNGMWYLHGNYKSGYTYKGRIIGHHMGTNADDLFVRFTHYLTANWLLGGSFDRERKSWEANSAVVGKNQTRDQWDVDLAYLGVPGLRIMGEYRYEKFHNHLFKDGKIMKNHIFGLTILYYY